MHKRKLPHSTIEAAISGDSEAIEDVLNHYSDYIRSICSSYYYEDGRKHYCVDEEMYSRITAKLTDKIMRFKID